MPKKTKKIIMDANEEFKDCVICGYTVPELVIFADACRKAGISNQDLATFCGNAVNAYNYIIDEVKNSLEKSVNNTMGGVQ